jgi:predicted PurR-regulated permease PerM
LPQANVAGVMDRAARSPTDLSTAPDVTPPAAISELAEIGEGVSYRRDRLLSSLVFIAGVALLLGAPFALRAGAIFFMPIAVALVITLMLVPAQEWLERHRVPSGLAALLVLLLFLIVANVTLVAIVLPAAAWVQLLPSRVPQIQANLAPIFELFATLERLSERLSTALGARAGGQQASVVADQANSALELITQSAPAALIQMLLIVLLVYFFLAAYTEMRVRLIRNRNSFSGSLRVARMIRDTVSSTASYLLTVTAINLGLGLVVAFVVWMLGMPSPLMWGGIAAVTIAPT